MILENDSELAIWILELANAGEDCRSRLAQVKGLIDAQ